LERRGGSRYNPIRHQCLNPNGLPDLDLRQNDDRDNVCQLEQSIHHNQSRREDLVRCTSFGISGANGSRYDYRPVYEFCPRFHARELRQWNRGRQRRRGFAGAPVTVTSLTTATAQLKINSAATIGAARCKCPNGRPNRDTDRRIWCYATFGRLAQITDFNPKSGSVGTPVTITGSNFTPNAGTSVQVSLNKQGGGSISAPVGNYTATSIPFTIPSGAAPGPITVTVNGNSVSSTMPLTITASSSFRVTAAPSPADLIQGQSVGLDDQALKQ